MFKYISTGGWANAAQTPVASLPKGVRDGAGISMLVGTVPPRITHLKMVKQLGSVRNADPTHLSVERGQDFADGSRKNVARFT